MTNLQNRIPVAVLEATGMVGQHHDQRQLYGHTTGDGAQPAA